ncbi:DNA-binding protein [Cereibacter sphaeroides]|nr:DNA-binding protein [Cereibacter sphaeroides]
MGRAQRTQERIALLRNLAAQGLTVRQAADRLGEKWNTIWKFASAHDIPFKAEVSRRRISRAAFEAMWRNPSMKRDDISSALGSPRKQTATEIAKALGLSKRPPGGRRPEIDVKLFKAMFEAGVSNIEIGQCIGVNRDTVRIIAARLNLPPRGKTWTPKLSLAEFRVSQIAAQMADVAAREQAAREALQKAVAA